MNGERPVDIARFKKNQGVINVLTKIDRLQFRVRELINVSRQAVRKERQRRLSILFSDDGTMVHGTHG